MKKCIAILLVALLLSASFAVSEEFIFEATEAKTLVACFSCTGNTWALATYAAEALGADLFRIEAEIPYTDEDLAYWVSDCRANREMNDDACRPALRALAPNMAQYETVILASPTWWGQAPRIIETFIESHDLSGKTVLHFSTSASSGYGRTGAILAALTDDSVRWLDGARLSPATTAAEMTAWLTQKGLLN